MAIIECRTAAEVYSALKSGDIPNIVEGEFRIEVNEGSPTLSVSGKASPTIVCVGYSSPRIMCRASSFPRIECWGSSSPRIVCLDSSSPRIGCWDYAAPTVVCSGSSSPTIECLYSSSPRIECLYSSSPTIGCWEKSAPRIMCGDNSSPLIDRWETSTSEIEAKESAHIRVFKGGPHITATPSVRVSILRGDPTIVGTTQIYKITENTPEAWCQFYGVPIHPDGTVILYKALNEGFKARNDFEYLPGSCPIAPDWDPERECGGGLHFSPNPREAFEFNIWASHFVACPILLSEIKTHIFSGVYPEKVKAPRVFKPCYEVDIEGNPLTDKR
jgi:hypothetical protein